MIDLIRALLGPRHCDWCLCRPASWFDRLLDGDKFTPEQRQGWRRYARTVWYRWVIRAPFWRVGEAWHWRFHAREVSS